MLTNFFDPSTKIWYFELMFELFELLFIIWQTKIGFDYKMKQEAFNLVGMAEELN